MNARAIGPVPVLYLDPPAQAAPPACAPQPPLEPEPLRRPMPRAESYPLDALGPILAPAARSIERRSTGALAAWIARAITCASVLGLGAIAEEHTAGATSATVSSNRVRFIASPSNPPHHRSTSHARQDWRPVFKRPGPDCPPAAALAWTTAASNSASGIAASFCQREDSFLLMSMAASVGAFSGGTLEVPPASWPRVPVALGICASISPARRSARTLISVAHASNC